MTSTVKSFNAIRGYGFLANPMPGGKDIFVHATQIQPPWKYLVVGDTVSFDAGTNVKGPCAVNVKVLAGQRGPVFDPPDPQKHPRHD